MSSRTWWKRKQQKQFVREAPKAEPGSPWDSYAPPRELLFADESLERVAGFVAQQERLGEEVGPIWAGLDRVAAWVARGQRSLAVEEPPRLLEDEGEDALSYFQFWHYLRQLGEEPGPEVATRILGLVIEHARQGQPELLAAYWDGTARWLDANGGFKSFASPNAIMVDNVRLYLGVCGPLVEATSPSKGPRPAPPVGARCRITVLTPAGLRSREETWDALWDDAVCGPVLDMVGALSERLLEDLAAKKDGKTELAPWPDAEGRAEKAGPWCIDADLPLPVRGAAGRGGVRPGARWRAGKRRLARLSDVPCTRLQTGGPMGWMDWLKRKPPKRLAPEGAQAMPGAAGDLYAPLRELIFADESLEGVARFVLQQEAMGTEARDVWKRLAEVAALVAQGHRQPAVAALYRLLEDEGEDARSCFQFWNYLRQLGERPAPAVATRILGLVIEHARHGGPEILAAYWDGTARLMDASGDFRMFTEPAPFMVANVRRFLRVCRPLAEEVEPMSGPRSPPPSGARCRVTVLTPAGLRSREGEWDALWDDAVCGPVLERAGALTERLLAVLEENGAWRSGVAPWPSHGGRGPGGSQVH